MKYIERIFVMLILVGLAMDIVHIKGYELLITVGFGGLSCLYYPFGFIVYNGVRLSNIFIRASYASLARGAIILSVLAGILNAFLLLGILHKLLHWPGASPRLMIGVVLNVMLAIIYSFTLRTKKPVLYRAIIVRTLVILLVAVGVAFTMGISTGRSVPVSAPVNIR